jgi:hemerythrin-like metal-binding protein
MTPDQPSTVAPRSSPSAGQGFWRPDLFTGIPEVDEQHRELLAQIGALEEAARSGDLDLAAGMLTYLERYAAEHFATEERVMSEYGYPDRDTHWSLHLAFAVELARRKTEHVANRLDAADLVDLGQWMDRWLNEHVLQADTDLARFVQCHAGSAMPHSPP